MNLTAVIYAKDLDGLVEFYSALGLTVDEIERGNYAVLTGTQVELSIVQIPKDIASEIQISVPPEARSRTPIKLAFSVPSIDAALEAVQPLGGRPAGDAKRWRFRGHEIQDALDPEGNVFQLRQPL